MAKIRDLSTSSLRIHSVPTRIPAALYSGGIVNLPDTSILTDVGYFQLQVFKALTRSTWIETPITISTIDGPGHDAAHPENNVLAIDHLPTSDIIPPNGYTPAFAHSTGVMYLDFPWSIVNSGVAQLILPTGVSASQDLEFNIGGIKLSVPSGTSGNLIITVNPQSGPVVCDGILIIRS